MQFFMRLLTFELKIVVFLANEDVRRQLRRLSKKI